jgi:hypothetical protein
MDVTETTTGGAPAASTRLNAPSYESVLAASQWATQHNRGRGLLTVSESGRGLRVSFSNTAHQHEALRVTHELGYAATEGDGHGVVVTGWDPNLLAQRADRALVELRALGLAHREVASTTLGRVREQLAVGITGEDAVAAAVAVVDTEDVRGGPSDGADTTPAWAAVPITRMEIGTASGTLRAQLKNVAAIEQAILIQHNTTAAAIAHSTARLFFEYRDQHGYDEHEAAGYAFAEVAEGIDAAYDVAWAVSSDSVEHADAGGRHQTRSAAVARWPEARPFSPRLLSVLAQDALADLAGVFGDSMTAADVGGHMTCTEADAIARALLAGGHRLAASRWLAGHARGDDDPETDRQPGHSFDLDTYLDGLDPRHVIGESEARGPSQSHGRDQPTAVGRERSERDTPAGAPADLEQWAPVVRALAGSAVVEDPAWPSLAHAIDRAHAAGWDVRDGLPRLIAQHEMPDRHPVSELHYRLMIDCPAAMPTPPAPIDAHLTAATPRAAVPADAVRPGLLPAMDQPPPSR